MRVAGVISRNVVESVIGAADKRPRISHACSIALLVSVLVVLGILLSLSSSAVLLILAPAGILMGALRPNWLLVLVLFSIPFSFYFQASGVPLTSELIKILLCLAVLFDRLGRKQQLVFATRITIPILVIGGLVISSVFRLLDPEGLVEILRLLSNVALFFCVLNLIRTERQLFPLFFALLVSALIVGCYGLYQYFYIHDYGPLWEACHPNLMSIIGFPHWPERVTSTLTTDNECAAYLNVVIPCVVLYFLSPSLKRRWPIKVLGWATFTVLVTTLILTFSRGGWIALAFSLAFLGSIFVIRQKKWLRMILGALAVLVLIATLFYSLGLWDALLLRLDVENYIVLSRRLLFNAGLAMFLRHPIWGVGYTNFARLYTYYGPWTFPANPLIGPHNIYVFILSQLGITGLIAFGWIFIVSLDVGIRHFFRYRTGEAIYAQMAIACGLLSALIHGFVDDASLFTGHTQYLVWFELGLFYAIERFPKKTRPMPDRLVSPEG